jgi:hypothetical protein
MKIVLPHGMHILWWGPLSTFHIHDWLGPGSISSVDLVPTISEGSEESHWLVSSDNPSHDNGYALTRRIELLLGTGAQSFAGERPSLDLSAHSLSYSLLLSIRPSLAKYKAPSVGAVVSHWVSLDPCTS